MCLFIIVMFCNESIGLQAKGTVAYTHNVFFSFTQRVDANKVELDLRRFCSHECNSFPSKNIDPPI